jgi:hypothetical protein
MSILPSQSLRTYSVWLLYGLSMLWGILSGWIWAIPAILLELVRGTPLCTELSPGPCVSFFDWSTPLTMGIGGVLNALLFGVTVRLWRRRLPILKQLYFISGVLITLGTASFHVFFLDYAFDPAYPRTWLYNLEGLAIFSTPGLVSLVPLGVLIGSVLTRIFDDSR